MRMTGMSLIFALLTAASSAGAAIPSKNAATKPQRILSGAGAITGGVAGSGFSMTNVALAKTAQKDRVVIDIGDLSGKALKGYPGYYHAEYQENPPRLILDFSQMPNAQIEESEIQKKLKGSKRVTSAKMLLDPTDQTLSLILNLKKGTKAQIFQVKGEKGTGRVVVDLQ